MERGAVVTRGQWRRREASALEILSLAGSSTRRRPRQSQCPSERDRAQQMCQPRARVRTGGHSIGTYSNNCWSLDQCGTQTDSRPGGLSRSSAPSQCADTSRGKTRPGPCWASCLAQIRLWISRHVMQRARAQTAGTEGRDSPPGAWDCCVPPRSLFSSGGGRGGGCRHNATQRWVTPRYITTQQPLCAAGRAAASGSGSGSGSGSRSGSRSGSAAAASCSSASTFACSAASASAFA
jgi:hypothetical protein